MASRSKSIALNALLAGIAVVGPFVAYAGVQAIYPGSAQTVSIDTTPPITFAAGPDYAQAAAAGFASGFTASNNGASFTMTVNGLAGGEATVDKLVNISCADCGSAQGKVASFRLVVSTSWAVGGFNPDSVRYRVWADGTGCGTPPTDGTVSYPCRSGEVDLEGSASAGGCDAVATLGNCTGKIRNSRQIQLYIDLPTGAAGASGTVSVRADDIIFNP